MKIIERLIISYQDNNDSNFLCYVAGESDRSLFLGVPAIIRGVTAIVIIRLIIELPAIMPILNSLIESLEIDWDLFWGDTVFEAVIIKWPLHIGGAIFFGGLIYDWYYGFISIPANGWVYTHGLNGIKTWEGSFYGKILTPLKIILRDTDGVGVLNKGVSGFIGIKISGELLDAFFFGSALHVKLGPEPLKG